MGTNYYTHLNQHIGKSSCGWKFLFRYYNNYNTIEDVKNFIKLNKIFNEYGEEVTFEEFWENVESRQNDKMHTGKIYKNIDNYDFLDIEFC